MIPAHRSRLPRLDFADEADLSGGSYFYLNCDFYFLKICFSFPVSAFVSFPFNINNKIKKICQARNHRKLTITHLLLEKVLNIV